MLNVRRKAPFALVALIVCSQWLSAMGQQASTPNVRAITVQEAVNYALANYPAVRAALAERGIEVRAPW